MCPSGIIPDVTFNKQWSQSAAPRCIYPVFSQCGSQWPLEATVCVSQTQVDCVALLSNISAEVTLCGL